MFAKVFFIALAMAVAPGPDFFLVLRNSLRKGRAAGIMTGLGVASAMTIHATYSILGIALLITSHPAIYSAVRICGGLYLMRIAWECFFPAAPSPKINAQDARSEGAQADSDLKESGNAAFVSPQSGGLLTAWKEGLLCNLLNPKAMLFFLSIFTQFLTPETSRVLRWAYGAEVVLIVGVWFVLLAWLLTLDDLRARYAAMARKIDVAAGAIFGGLGGSIFFEEGWKIAQRSGLFDGLAFF